MSVLSATPFVGAGAGWARRASRVRLSAGLTAGALDAALAARGELLLGYQLTPGRRRGIGVYAAGGVAVTATRQTRAERLVALFGIEGTPGGSGGWYLEAGVAGGVRLATGFRWRGLRR